eukprot:TRINITY_DN739_c0_g1_i2.p1 TRINITY_DN739_c0_g1~~TRINITY_DN739_c0_g1_i2.p1  ORF type:complete len:302 (-),score=43.37 TRINITY_DN739_c0_g1_i2:36-941(-)
MRASLVRQGIAGYLQNLWDGTLDEKRHVGMPMMLMWGNAFLFNSEMVQEMRRQWHFLGKTMPADVDSSGCPDWMEGHSFWPDDCAQDIVYPTMVMVMNPPVGAYGESGCGKNATNLAGKRYPLACYQMSENPLGGALEKPELALIKEIALRRQQEVSARETGGMLVEMGERPSALSVKRNVAAVAEDSANQLDVLARHRSRELRASVYARKVDAIVHKIGGLTNGGLLQDRTMQRARDLLKGFRAFGAVLTTEQSEIAAAAARASKADEAWELFMPSWEVPIMHEVKWASVHKLAQELLGF